MVFDRVSIEILCTKMCCEVVSVCCWRFDVVSCDVIYVVMLLLDETCLLMEIAKT